MSITNRVILIISDTNKHLYIFLYHGTSSTHIQSLKYSSYSSYLTTLIFDLVLISALHNSTHTHESQNKCESRMNPEVLARRLCVCSACFAVYFAYVSVFFCYRVTQIIHKYFSK